MCEQCMAETKTYGEVLPRWWLVQATKNGHEMKAGDFGLVVCNDPDYIWPENLAPRKDPSFGMTDEEFDNMTDETGVAWDEFNDYVEQFSKYLNSDPLTGWMLVNAAKEAGWSRETHGFLTGWLFHRMAVVIERNPTADEEICERYALQDEAAWGYSRDETGIPRKQGDEHDGNTGADAGA